MNFDNDRHGSIRRTYDLNSRIMVTAILSLTFVILLVLILHIYARYVLRLPRRNLTSTFIHHHLVHHAEPISEKSGLDPMVINLLPSFLFKQMEGHDDNNDIECAVCLSMLEENELARRLPNCNHIFHMVCIDKWLCSQPTCPICRSEVSPQLAPLDREPPMGSELTEVVVVTSEGHELDHEIQVVTNSRNCNNPSKINTGSGSSMSSSFRMSSFRRIIGRERSSSSSRMQVCEEIGLERQVQQ